MWKRFFNVYALSLGAVGKEQITKLDANWIVRTEGLITSWVECVF